MMIVCLPLALIFGNVIRMCCIDLVKDKYHSLYNTVIFFWNTDLYEDAQNKFVFSRCDFDIYQFIVSRPTYIYYMSKL